MPYNCEDKQNDYNRVQLRIWLGLVIQIFYFLLGQQANTHCINFRFRIFVNRVPHYRDICVQNYAAIIINTQHFCNNLFVSFWQFYLLPFGVNKIVGGILILCHHY